MSGIHIGQDLALLVLDLTLDSSTHVRILNEISWNSYKEAK
jgi:hypothetical protein